MNRRKIVSVCLVLLGVLFISTYLTDLKLGMNPSIDIFVLGVILCSCSTIVAIIWFPKSYTLLFLVLLILSYSLLTIYSFRYDVFGGEDVIGEYVIATKTATSERWPWTEINVGAGDRPGRYASCLSVTILPAILSKVMGIDVLNLYRFVMPLVGACIPFALLLLTKEIFDDDRLALITAVLFAVSHLYLFSLNYMFREQIGYFLLLLSSVAILKKKPLLTIVFLTGLVLADAGHVATTLGLIVLLSFLISPLLANLRLRVIRGKRQFHHGLDRWPFIFMFYFSALTFAWLYFFAPPIMMQLINRTIIMIPTVISRLPTYLMTVLTTGLAIPSGSLAAVGISTSPILKYWYYLDVFLVFLGLLVSLIWISNRRREIAWTVVGIVIFLGFSMSVLAPWYLPELDASRFIAAPIIMPFLALIIWLPWKLRIRHRHMIFLLIPSLIFVSVSLPLNMSLMDYGRILHFSAEEKLLPSARGWYPDTTFADLQFAQWVTKRISEDKVVTTDFRGYLITYLAGHVAQSYKTYPSFNFSTSSYLILPNTYIVSNLWFTPYYGAYPSQNATAAQVLNSSDMIYNNGKDMLISRTPNQGV